MTVRDDEGRKLGTVINLGDTYFELEQGSPARRDFMVTYHRVARVQGSDVILLTGDGMRVPAEDDGPLGGQAR